MLKIQKLKSLLAPAGTLAAHLLMAAPAAAADRPELTLKRLVIADSEHEISGVAGAPASGMLVVADAAEDNFLYRLNFRGSAKTAGRFSLVRDLDLSRLQGYADYLKVVQAESRVEVKDRRLDLEGMAQCGQTTYLINERVRQVLIVEDRKRIRLAPIDFSGFAALFGGGSNAGFEGIAADCAAGVLWVAKEREPRALFRISMDGWKVTDTFDLPASDRSGQKVINIFTGNGLLEIAPDFGDLFFENGWLYALERNTFEIAKIDINNKTVVARVSYLKTELQLYETMEPFGQSEALLLTADEIWVGVDNNQNPVAFDVARKNKASGRFGSFMVFSRPAGF